MFKGRDFPFNDIGEMTSHEDTLVKREITPLEHLPYFYVISNMVVSIPDASSEQSSPCIFKKGYMVVNRHNLSQ